MTIKTSYGLQKGFLDISVHHLLNLKKNIYIYYIMNNLREIKKSRLLHDESFTYMISSNERTNDPTDPEYLTNFYNFNFGGFCAVFWLRMGPGTTGSALEDVA